MGRRLVTEATGNGRPARVYDDPTPADLLTDPRVLALVEELRWVHAYARVQRPSRQHSIAAALAPFEVTP